MLEWKTCYVKTRLPARAAAARKTLKPESKLAWLKLRDEPAVEG